MGTGRHLTMRVRRMAGLITGAALAAALLVPAAAMAQGELTIEKYVSAVNGAAPDAAVPVTLIAGDSVSYGLSVSSDPSLGGTEVTITDVFDANLLTFEGAEPSGCTEGDGEVSCLVTLDDEGATEVLFSFSVLPASGGSDCQQLVNTATVSNEDGGEATSESSVDLCTERSGTAAGTGGGAQTGSADTALPLLPGSGTSPTIVLGAIIIWLATLLGLHRSMGVARDR